MNKVVKLSQEDGLNRDLFHLFIPEFEDFPKELKLPSKYFVLLFVGNVDLIAGEKLLSWADNLIDRGIAYFCAWGNDCQKAENAVDLACVKKNNDEEAEYYGKNYFVMTTSHKEDSLDEFLWFGLNLSYPDEKHEKDCESNLVVVVENKDWNEQIIYRISDVQSFNKMMLEEETDNRLPSTNN